MFRPMRRDAQQLTSQEAAAVLNRGSNGILAVHGDEGYPYAVPLSYVYHNEKIYFHCAKMGHKLDAMLACPRVCFTVVDQDRIVERRYTSYYRSVIAFGRARVVEDPQERLEGFWALVEKYCPHQPEEANRREIQGCGGAHLVAIDLEQVTGKQARELAAGNPPPAAPGL